MRYANLIPHSHIARSPDARLTADSRRAFITSRAAIVAATESAKRFARTEALVQRELLRGLIEAPSPDEKGIALEAVPFFVRGRWELQG